MGELVPALGIEQLAFGRVHAKAAQEAFLRFGKGRHRAALNLGDCFSYAAAAVENEPLLFKRDDFAHTEIAAVPY